ncbi:hypothetical protein CMUS01_13516 [Colletotrichum musicola]|uniref:Uncharacterized protein n=1 Tax=Colletotrichum musicola TaxID=2175873 RepID=A0A8H6MW08_9PEZI|nr:hypothetical protein CMUS01_13516 [Colletotrichum musicola]
MSAQTPPATEHIYEPSKVTEGATLPRSEDLETYHLCPEAGLIVWAVPGPLRDIAVLDITAPPPEAFARRQPFAIFGPNDEPTTFHLIASLPAVYPLVSSLTVCVDHLEEFMSECEIMSEQHEFEPGSEDRDTNEYCICEECKEHPFLLYKQPPKLYVEAKEKPYVTLGDVVLAVNGWILKIWQDILLAEKAMFDEYGTQWPPLPADTKFWINGPFLPTEIMLGRQEPTGSGSLRGREKYWQECISVVAKRQSELRDKAM